MTAVWLIVGFCGQFLFALRFIFQWISSERRKESHIPIIFWHLSIVGGIMLLIYAVYRKDPVFIAGQSTGLIVYVRNLVLIYRKEKGGKG
ncbi:MAG: lipid-A-disaccharide synthase N-terminal domain-containing protein [Candidatus Omnitrophica bacterium]|nr:lipid-A-disaccharide synthase N-terminal domain-containing protein [Candidatus Omnitrophota bacterium]